MTNSTLRGKPDAGNPHVRISVSAVVLAFACAFAEAATTYTWKADGDEYSGSFTNALHWSPTPAEGEWPGCGYPDSTAHFGE